MMKRGKREAKRTGLGRRLLSVFLAVVMCTSMLQLSVFAAEPTDAVTKQAQEQILGGATPKYYTWDATNSIFGETTSDKAEVKNGQYEDVVISKSIAPTGVENEFEITLDVKTNQTVEKTVTYPNVAVTLVLDVSNSMKPADMIAMKNALIGDGAFLDKLAANANGAKRMVSVVAFCKDTTLESGWVDITDAAKMEVVKSKINNLITDGGTCTQGGLLQAKNLLEQNVVSPEKFAYRYAVLMTDGNPNTIVTKANVAADNYVGYYYNYGTPLDLWNKEDKYQGSDWWKHKDFKSEKQPSFGDPSIYAAYRAEKVSEEIRALPNTELYAIGYGNDLSSKIHDGAYTDPSRTSRKLITGETWLAQNVVEQSDHYFKADMSGLSTVFQAIVNEITVQAGAWMVTDPMGEHIVLDESSLNGVAGAHVSYTDDRTPVLQWNLRQATQGNDGSYTMTYKVRLDVADIINDAENALLAENPEATRAELDDAVEAALDKHHLTNGATSLTYYIRDENGDYLNDKHEKLGASELDQALMTMYFKVPAVKGYAAELAFTKVGSDGKKLLGAQFSLTNAAGTWSDVATSDKNGNVIFAKKIPSGDSYTLTETTVPTGYLEVGPFEFTVAYGEGVPSFNGGKLEDPAKVAYTDVTITKVWQKPANESTPDSISVTLKQNGKNFLTKTITKAELDADSTDTTWKYTFTNLPANNESGEVYTYTVEEDSMYGWAASYGEQDPLTIINTANGTTIVSVTKNWILPEGMESAPVVTVSLMANGKPTGKTATLRYSASGDTYYFVDLPKYDANGQLITYSVTEAQGTYQMANAIEYGSEGMINTAVITNTVADEKTTVSGTKYWNDDMSGRPDSITVTLYADGKEAGTAVATADTNWQYNFTDLPRYEFTRDGNNITAVREITYTVEEIAVEGYTSVVDGYNVTNTRTGVVDLTVHKVWVDVDESTRSSIEVQLYANGVAYGDSVWMEEEYTFENLPKYDEFGLEIDWSVQEIGIPAGYTPSYSDVTVDEVEGGNDMLSVTITNTENTVDDTLTVMVTKVWQQPGDVEAKTATFQLYKDGEPVESKVLQITGNGIGSFENLAKYKPVYDEKTGDTDLVEIVYDVSEDVPSGYSCVLSNAGNLVANSNGDMVYHFVNTIVDEISVSVQKQWVKPATVETPDVTFTVQRTISGEWEDVGTIVLENGETSGKLSGLDEYNEYGQRYTYSIVEESLSGYSAAITGGVQADGNYAYDVVNTINPANVNLVVSKTWIDGGLDDSERPSVKLWALQNGMDGGLYNGQPDVRWVEFYYDATEDAVMAMTQDNNVVAATVSGDGNTWSYTFTLPKYSQDLTMEYTYSVAEYDVPTGYVSVVNGTTATNTRVGTIDIPVTKYWVDPAGTNRPEITLTLTGSDSSSRTIVMNDDANGVVTATLNGEALEAAVADNAWTVTVAGLPQYDSNGAEITYTLSEQEVSGYTSSTVEGQPFAICNTIKQQNISADAAKVWANMEVQGVYTPEYPESITVALFRNGVKVDGSEQTVTKESNYKIAEYTDLPKYASDGSVFSYQVMELNAEGNKVDNNGTITFGHNNDYTVTYGEDGTITNTFIVPAKYLWVVKTNYIHENYDGTLISSYSHQTEVYAEIESKTVSVDPADYAVCSDDGLTYNLDTSKTNITSASLDVKNRLYELEINYILVEEAPPAPPSGGGGGGGGGGTTTIPENPTPLNPAPELEEIPEEDVPLTDLPEDDLEDLLDEEVPLAMAPATGDVSAIWMALSALSGAGLFLTRKKREDE